MQTDAQRGPEGVINFEINVQDTIMTRFFSIEVKSFEFYLTFA